MRRSMSSNSGEEVFTECTAKSIPCRPPFRPVRRHVLELPQTRSGAVPGDDRIAEDHPITGNARQSRPIAATSEGEVGVARDRKQWLAAHGRIRQTPNRDAQGEVTRRQSPRVGVPQDRGE